MNTPLLLTREPATEAQSLADYRKEGGYAGFSSLDQVSPAQILEELEASKLRGRGGAAFPAARKWKLAQQAEATVKYTVANGGEHEPGSHKDRHLVQYYPHRVLEGMLWCGYATGAKVGYLYLIEDMAAPIAAAERAIEEATEAGLLCTALGNGFEFEIKIHRAPTTYVAGEETAALDSIEGGPGKPREKPPYPGEAGLFGQPTTVNNVETLAHVAWIRHHGAPAFAAIGTEESTGTMLFTLGKEVNRPGVYEMPFGTTYRQLLEDCGGGVRGEKAVRAVLPALSCRFLSADQLDTPIAYETMKSLGTSPGCGGVHVIVEGQDVMEKVASIADFFMKEQCGQCPPCRMETNQFAHILKGVRDGKRGDFSGQLEKIARFTAGKGRCSLIEMAAAPVLSAAEVFRSDFEACATEAAEPE